MSAREDVVTDKANSYLVTERNVNLMGDVADAETMMQNNTGDNCI